MRFWTPDRWTFKPGVQPGENVYNPGMNNSKLTFADAIIKRRTELGMSQEKLAELSSLNPAFLAEIERGSRNVSLENILKLVRALDLPIGEFFSHYFIEEQANK